TFEQTAREHGIASITDSRVAQLVAPMGQPMPPNSPLTQNAWRSRGVMLLEEIGPSILITQGDGALFAKTVADAKPELVKAVSAIEDRSFQQTLEFIASKPSTNPANAADPHPNKESTALKLADQGSFWVGVQQKKMPYGTIAMGQMHVQY